MRRKRSNPRRPLRLYLEMPEGFLSVPAAIVILVGLYLLIKFVSSSDILIKLLE